MISFDPDTLAAANREAERKIRFALEGSGTVRAPWPREQGFWRWIVGTVLAGIAVGIFLAWVLT